MMKKYLFLFFVVSEVWGQITPPTTFPISFRICDTSIRTSDGLWWICKGNTGNVCFDSPGNSYTYDAIHDIYTDNGLPIITVSEGSITGNGVFHLAVSPNISSTISVNMTRTITNISYSGTTTTTQTYTGSFYINVAAPQVPSVTKEVVTYYGQTMIKITASGCSSPYCGYILSDDSTGISNYGYNSTGDFYVSPICKKYYILTSFFCLSNSTSIMITPLPPQVISSKESIECSQEVTLTASGCPSTMIVQWTNGKTGSTISEKPSSTQTYKAYCKDLTGECQSDMSNLKTITVTPIPKPIIIATNLPICKGASTSLSASCETGAVQWSTGETTGSITVTPTETTTYFAHCVLDDCISDDENKKIEVVKVYAPSINSTTSYLCGEGSVFVTGICGTGTISWTAGGGSGSSFTQYLTATNVYKGVCSDQGCSSDETSLTIPVLPTPAPPSVSANKNLICAGQNAILTATGCTQRTLWSTGDAGTTITVSSSGTYKARCIFQSCPSVWESTVIAVSNKPAVPSLTVSQTYITTGQTSTLTASNCNGIILWSANPSSSPLPTGSGGSVSPTESTLYKIKCKIGDCESDEASAVVIVNYRENTPIVNAVTIKAGTQATLTATGCTGQISWYNALTDGSPIRTGATFTTPTLTNTGTFTYYASCYFPGVAGSESLTRAVGTITVIPNPCLDNPNQTISQDIFEGTALNPAKLSASEMINSTSKIGNQYLNAVVEFKAGKSIILNNGFKVESGTVFLAHIGGCN